MDAPNPLETKSFSFTMNKEETGTPISLTIENKNNACLILAKDNSNIGCNEFKSSFTNQDFCKLNKAFRMFETIGESIEFITQIIQSKEAKIYSEDSELYLELNITMGVKKEKVKIKLNKGKISLESTVSQLCETIMIMQKEINELKKAVYGDPNLSLGEIVKNENEKKLLLNEIEKKLNTKVKGTKLLFSTKIDGDLPATFHLKCDNKSNTLTLIQAENGRRFGGFASLPWCSIDIYKDDKVCFLFSLDNMEIYQYKNDGKAVHCHKDYGPSFGSAHDINILNNCLSEKKCYTSQGSFDYNNRTSLLSGISGYIKLSLYEVYEIKI